jgi:F-type H+-transporting ATPase subunit delta
MAETKVSTRYASSLIDLALENNTLDTLSKDMELVHSAILSSNELNNLLHSPVVKNEMKRSILSEIFKNKISKSSLDFIEFIVDKNREYLLDSIIEKFLEMRDEKLGIVRVEVKTSFDFTDDQKAKLKQRLENILNKKAQLNFIIDSTIVGGFIAKVGDTVYDASIKHQLELLRKEFLQGSVQLN